MMKENIKNLKSVAAAEAALNVHRADRQANRARREELNTLIGDYQAEMTLLEDEYRLNNDEDEILRRIGQIAVGE